jgi:hypothetical protein
LLKEIVNEDLKNLENMLLKLASIYINKGLAGREHVQLSYVEELRHKMGDRKSKTFVSWFNTN